MAGTSKKTSNPKGEFIKLFENLSRRYYRTEVFADFLDYSLTFFKLGAKAEDFDVFKKKWNEKGDMQTFLQLFYLYGEMAEHNGKGFYDPLGDIFMETITGRDAKYKGQFFTPPEVSDMMAMITVGEKLEDGKKVADPACGSGRTLLSMAKINRKLFFCGADVDQLCCKMTLLNMLVNSLEGEVAWMNSLSLEHYKTWHAKTVLTWGGKRLPYYIEVKKEQTLQLKQWEQRKKEREAASKTTDGNDIGKNNQIQLF